VPFSVVQGIEPGIWKWSVDLDGHSKSGEAHARPAAIKAAERVIDRMLKPKKLRLDRPGR